jgi:D-3-phosphoglycerate dehydrogenase
MPGSTLGIIGLGAIGKGVARRARGFDMRVLAYDVAFDKDFAGLYGVEEVGLEELLGESDFVSLHCPVTPETEGLISGERIKLMKRSAYLVNTARAELIDECALRDALKEGRVAGAALDVFRVEPPWASPLVELDNVILTPHTGACTRQTIERMALRSVENALAVLEGSRPKSVVNPEVYDKE